MLSTLSHRDHSSHFVMFCLFAILAVFGRPAQADYHPPYTFLNALGGPAGDNLEEMCPDDRNLIGFDLRTGDDVDAIRPICALAYVPNLGGDYQATVPSEVQLHTQNPAIAPLTRFPDDSTTPKTGETPCLSPS